MTVIYVVNSFPTTSETFVFDEVKELLIMGKDILFYPLRKDKTGKNALDLSEKCIDDTNSNSEWSYLLRFISKKPQIAIPFVLKVTIQSRLKIRMFFSKLSSIGHACKLHDLVIRKNLNYEIIFHSHFVGRTTEVCLYLNQLFQDKYCVTAHAADIYVIKNRLDITQRLGHAWKIRTISKFGKDFLISNQLVKDPEKIAVIHCGVKISALAPSCVANRFHKEKKIILGIGRLVEKKGFIYLIRAGAKLITCDSNILLVLIGDGPKYNELIKEAEVLGISSKILFTGAISNTKVIEWLDRASVMVLPCVKDSQGDMDGIPVSLMESMASMVPVVSTYISGIPELINNEMNGLLVEEKNVADLEMAIKRIIENDNLAEDLAYNAMKTIEQEFNIITIAQQLTTFLGLDKQTDDKSQRLR